MAVIMGVAMGMHMERHVGTMDGRFWCSKSAVSQVIFVVLSHTCSTTAKRTVVDTCYGEFYGLVSQWWPLETAAPPLYLRHTSSSPDPKPDQTANPGLYACVSFTCLPSLSMGSVCKRKVVMEQAL